VEARQRVKLSLTNRSIGLFYPATASRAAESPQEDMNDTKTAQASVRRIASILEYPQRHIRRQPTAPRAVGRPGGHSEGPAPDPIPNSAVKTLRANGTAS
jgi:hypothetical protein